MFGVLCTLGSSFSAAVSLALSSACMPSVSLEEPELSDHVPITGDILVNDYKAGVPHVFGMCNGLP